jgi:hypothetical protein
LEYSYYGSYLIPCLFLALSAELLYVERSSGGFCLAIAAAVLLLPWSPLARPIWAVLSQAGTTKLLGIAAAGLVGATIWRGRPFTVITAAVCLCVVNLYLLRGELDYRRKAPNGGGEAFARITTAMDFVDRQRQGRKVVFWYDNNDPNDHEFESLNSIYLWGYTWIGREFPALDGAAAVRAVAGSMLVVPTTSRSESSVVQDANLTLRGRGLVASSHAVAEIQGPAAHYRVVCLDLHRTGVTPNLALNMPAAQSSTALGAGAGNAVDGNTDGDITHHSVTHTEIQKNPWWQVDLGSSVNIKSVVIWNRTDAVSERLSDYWVFISDTPFLPTETPASFQGRAGIWSSHQLAYPNPSTTIAPNGAHGRYVRIQLNGTNYLSLAEVQVF